MKLLLKKLDKIIELLLADREERRAEKEEQQRAENDRMLIDYAQKHNKRVPSEIRNGRDAVNQPIQTGTDLIPYNLSERDKALLKLFHES